MKAVLYCRKHGYDDTYVDSKFQVAQGREKQIEMSDHAISGKGSCIV